MRRINAVIIASALLVTLTGCNETLEERAQNRDQCEALGGTYVEMINGFDYTYRDWRCELDTIK